MKISSPRPTPIKYSSAPTRFANFSALQGGAEINETPIPIGTLPWELPQNFYASNIRSSTIQRDLPSTYGFGGMRNLGAGLIMNSDDEAAAYFRPGGLIP